MPQNEADGDHYDNVDLIAETTDDDDVVVADGVDPAADVVVEDADEEPAAVLVGPP